MRKILIRLTTAFMVTLSVQTSGAETILQYISACKTQLGFTSVPTVKCSDGLLFADADHDPESGGSVNDYVGYARITDSVDMAFACRWLGRLLPDGTQNAVSIEMNIHNRQNGNTCFFSGKSYPDPNDHNHSPLVPATLVSITDPDTTKITHYWEAPADLDVSNKKCVNCHIAGPYIASPRIASFLARFGLLNNGHDTLQFVDQGSSPILEQPVRYHAVVTTGIPGVTSAFTQWDNNARSYIDDYHDGSDSNYDPYGCSSGCHSIGGASPEPGGTASFGFTVIPSILTDLRSVLDQGVMAPYDDNSDYRWINLDTPTNSIPSPGVETENFADAMNASTTLVPTLLGNCTAPGKMEAHAVGVDGTNAFSTDRMSWIPERLKYFNLKDGLVCLNADQDQGVTCSDYDVSYLCSDGSWTTFYNQTINTNGGDDHEEHANLNSLVIYACGGFAPVGIRARVFVNGRGGLLPRVIVGPNDRLARLSPYGLTCNNLDQPDGQCSNYVVRYESCISPPSSYTAHITSVYSPNHQLSPVPSPGNPNPPTRGQLYMPNSNTQQWSIEPVTNTEYVRLRNTNTNKYLNVMSADESAAVVTSTSSNSIGEQWIIEPVAYSNAVRLKNLGSGKYLTINNTGFISPIYSQGLVPSWTSQQWVIQ